jgi:L-alanine-DL-glutamate epimerase-like enolase superfamily enzyme
MKITNIEKITVDIPYLERVREHLQKCWNFANRATDDEFQQNYDEYLKQWQESQPPSVNTCIYKVHTDEGIIGIGEGDSISEDRIQTLLRKNPFEFIMDDSVGPLQIAFYDIMGKALNLPMSRLFGPIQRENVPVAYWSHCFPPEILRQEAKIALENGFTAHKIKRRAHTDIVEQIGSVSEVAPADYHITVDSNATLGSIDRALEVAKQLEKFPQVKCLESPIAEDNVEGYLLLKKKLSYPLAMHTCSLATVSSGMCDYFVLGGWAAGIMKRAALADAGDKSFWLQMGFTGISAIFMIHLAAAIKNASLSHVSLYFLLEDDLLVEPLIVSNGHVKVPEKPGIGVELDEDAVERYRVG